MKGIKPTLAFGCPLKIYQFTGEFQGVLQGFYKSAKNKKTVFVPIYVDYEGKRIIDMAQVREKGKI